MNNETIVETAARHQFEAVRHRQRFGKLSTAEYKGRLMFANARKRAIATGLPFNLDVWDIETPDLCPVFQIPLVYDNEGLQDNSPTLDRIRPELGYIKGNIKTICARANRLKSDASRLELLLLANYITENANYALITPAEQLVKELDAEFGRGG